MTPPSWLDTLTRELDDLDMCAMRRGLRVAATRGRHVYLSVNGRSCERVNFAGNDYLALCEHPRLIEAVTRAVGRHGFGSGASRLVTGHKPGHAAIEQRFAAFKHAPAALLCPTGYMANHAAITALIDHRDDLILLDKLNHASLIDAARATPAQVRTFAHRQYDKLERLLQRDARRKLIVTDSVFSMDGDVADLPRLCDLAERHDAGLLVDEAHGTGVLGPSGAGLAEAQGVADRIDVTVSTASKALGGLGGIVTGPQAVIDAIVNRARAFIYTTAVPVAQAAAIDAALDIVRDEPQRRERLATLSQRLDASLRERGWPQPESTGTEPTSPTDGAPASIATPIFPLIVGEAATALQLAGHLAAAGLHAPAIRPPTVAPGSARVRITLRSDLEDSDIDRLLAALDGWRMQSIR